MSDLQIHKYKYTNTQIQHWSKLQIDMTCTMQIHKYKYTNTQIHKYANIALVKVADRHYICYIFEKGNGKRASETIFLAV